MPEPPLELPLELPLEPPIAPLDPPVLLPEVESRLLPDTPAAPGRCDLRLDLLGMLSELEEDCPAEVPYSPLVVPDPPDVDEPVEPPLVCAQELPASDKALARSKAIVDLLCFTMISPTNS